MLVQYLGDTALDRAASYLAGIMSHHGISFNYQASDEAYRASEADVLIISDYPAKNFSDLSAIVSRVAQGMGLIMIGGWESFSAPDGHNYNGSALAEILPVSLLDEDDRLNCGGPCPVIKRCEHAVLDGLDLNRQLPSVAGFNRVGLKAGAESILEVVQTEARMLAGELDFSQQRNYPLLVVREHGRGRVVAFTGDVAPHWVGGLVDWGRQRITARAPGANEVEFGESYSRLFGNLIRWAGGGGA